MLVWAAPASGLLIALAAFVLAVIVGCSRESVGERLTRECGEIVDAASTPRDSVDAETATVLVREIAAVIEDGRGKNESEWASTPLRKAILTKQVTSPNEMVKLAEEQYPKEYNDAWQKAFERDLPDRQERRATKIRECIWQRGTRGDRR